MSNLAHFVAALKGYEETKRKLDLCRQTATGDVEYCCSDYRERLEDAGRELTNALNVLIDDRVAIEIARLTPMLPYAVADTVLVGR